MSSELVKYSRVLDFKLPSRQSAFLWGARKTGKSTYLHDRFPDSVRYDLLESDLYYRFSKEPHLLREELASIDKSKLKHPVIIDEIQKIPKLLDEVHWLIENMGIGFILCGSSARKLKRSHVNLLGGRAWRYEMYPLVSREIPDFDILRALNTGLIPSHYLSPNPMLSLKSYVIDYLNEEIREEGLTRNIPAFSRFLDSLVFSNGELTNYSNIASDCGVDSKTVKDYYQILIDTLLGYYVMPYAVRKGRETIKSTGKFYLFDVGVAGYLKSGSANSITLLKGTEAGRAFEHFILMEIVAWRGYTNGNFDINFWRTKTGLEVDFILSGKGMPLITVETKITDHVRADDIKGLLAFAEDFPHARSILVCNEKRARRIHIRSNCFIEVMPWRHCLEQLWAGELF